MLKVRPDLDLYVEKKFVIVVINGTQLTSAKITRSDVQSTLDALRKLPMQ